MEELVNKLPVVINPCPTAEAILEIRYLSKHPGDAIFGLFYGTIGDIFDNEPISLPILQLPEAIRRQDPALRFKAYHCLISPTLFHNSPISLFQPVGKTWISPLMMHHPFDLGQAGLFNHEQSRQIPKILRRAWPWALPSTILRRYSFPPLEGCSGWWTIGFPLWQVRF